MKVLIVFNHPAPYKVKTFNELAKLVDLTVIFERKTAHNRPLEFYSNNVYNFKHIFIDNLNVGNEGSLSRKVYFYIKQHHMEFDHIIMNGISHFAEIIAILYMIKSKIPYSVLINGGIAKNIEGLGKKSLKTKLISNAKFWMSPSKISDTYLLKYGAKKEKIYNYPYSNINANDIKLINKEEIRKKYNLPIDKQIFVNCSQFIKRKNNMELIKFFRNSKHVLLLIGKGIELGKYNRYIKKHHLQNIIIFDFMERESLFEIMRACNAFITLAKKDIYGQTTIEALACGLPVISSDKVNSSMEYIKDGINGFIITKENKRNLNKILEKTLDLSANNSFSSVKNITYIESANAIYEILNKEK